jgi:hypothetical protein
MPEPDTADRPFAELPAALVEELINKAENTGHYLIEEFRSIREEKSRFRFSLESKGLLKRDSDLGYPPLPTCCGVDGSYAIERLLTTDLAASAAVAVEGITPPSEKSYWPQPHHSTFVKAEKHNANTSTILRALMLGEELVLAAGAPHDLVFLDGSMTIPIIHFNQAINALAENEARMLFCTKELLSYIADFLRDFLTILENARSDKCWAAMPKYTSRRELGVAAGWDSKYDDRGILSMVLEPGELTQPVPLWKDPNQKWHIATHIFEGEAKTHAEKMVQEIIREIEKVKTFYYRPHTYLPALRIETSESVADNQHRLAVLVQGIKHQCASPGMMEPYPLYLADRMVKSLARAIPTFRHVATNRIADSYEGDIGEVFFGMHGYRTESGRK